LKRITPTSHKSETGYAEKISDTLFKQVTLTFNPWRRNHWLRRRFFNDTTANDADTVLAMTVTYHDNEFLDAADLKKFDDIAQRDPQRYAVVGCGEWGEGDSLVFKNVIYQTKDTLPVPERPLYGLDWGYYPDPTAFVACYMDGNRLIIYDEWLGVRCSSHDVYNALSSRDIDGEDVIICDNSDNRSTADLREYGLARAIAAGKGPGSLRYSMKWLQSLEAIVINPERCPVTAREFMNYEYMRDSQGEFTESFADKDNHCIDAVRYATNYLWRH